MSSHLYNKGETLPDGAYDHLDRSGLERQIATSRHDLQSVRQQLADTRARGSSGEGHKGERAGELNVRDWHQKLEYYDSKIHYIEREIELAERALYRLR